MSYSLASSRTDGSGSPGSHSPASIRSRNAALIDGYGGLAVRGMAPQMSRPLLERALDAAPGSSRVVLAGGRRSPLGRRC